jgi:hypothetical protein
MDDAKYRSWYGDDLGWRAPLEGSRGRTGRWSGARPVGPVRTECRCVAWRGHQGVVGHGASWGRCGLGRRAASGGAAVRTPRVARREARSVSKLFQVRPLQARFSLKFCTEVHKVVNRKDVDLTTLYNFYKGLMVFFSTVFA